MSRNYDDDDGADKPISFRSPNSRTADRYAGAADRYSSVAADNGTDRKSGGGGGDRYDSRGGGGAQDGGRGGEGDYEKRRGGKAGEGFFSNSSGGGGGDRSYDRGERSDSGGDRSGGGYRDDRGGDRDGGYQRRDNRDDRGRDDRGGDRRQGSSREDREREREERRNRIPAGLPDLDALQINDPNRPKLKLAPRSAAGADGGSRAAVGGSGKPNPFGDAKPREENLASKEPAPQADAKSAE